MMTGYIEQASDLELLETILGGGNPSAQRISGELYKEVPRIECTEEMTIKYGVKKDDAAKILAAVELGKRLAGAKRREMYGVHDPDTAALIMMPKLRYETKEKFFVMLLSTKGEITGIEQIATGSLNATVVSVRETFKPAIIHSAAAIICFHNHPSGNPEPSQQDRELTRDLYRSGKILGIPLVDHIIIGDGVWYSFKEHDNIIF